MKTSENKEKKQLRELSEEELKEVTGGSSIDCSLPENKDNVRCSDKLKGLGAIPNPVDFQFKTASFGWVDVTE